MRKDLFSSLRSGLATLSHQPDGLRMSFLHFYHLSLYTWGCSSRPSMYCMILILIFLAFDFCRFCMVIWFFHPRHNGQWPPTLKDFYTRSYPLHYFPILILEKEPVFPFLMLSAKQGNYWYHFYNVFGMTRSLTGDWTRDLLHSKPALYHLAIVLYDLISVTNIIKLKLSVEVHLR